jgi:hypothetical protein
MSNVSDDDLHNLLAALVEQARALASRMAGDPELPAPCQFCGGVLPLWENLLVLQLAGVPAHVRCPADTLKAKLAEVGPLPEFPYDEFSKAVDARIDAKTFCADVSGVVDALG